MKSLLLISFLRFLSPDSCENDSLVNVWKKYHIPIVMDISKVRYLLPCKWSCSCDYSIIHYGWLVEYEGKQYQLEGKRRDGKKNTTIFTDITE